MHFKFRNKQLTFKNKLNKLKVVHAEQTLCNKSNFIEFLKFTDQNTTHTIDTENNIVIVSTNLRSSGIEIKKADDTFFNTDIEITGTLTGGRNPYICDSSDNTNLTLLINNDKTFKIRFRCKHDQFKIIIADDTINNVSSELIINEIKVYKNKLNDSELDILKSSDISLTNLDTFCLINQTTELYPISSTGTTNTMKLYSRNEDMISFVNNKMYVHNLTGNCEIYCKNKYGIGQVFNLEILDDITVTPECQTKIITTNQKLPVTFSIYPESAKSKTTITTSNSNAYISENGITGVTPGNVNIIVTVDLSIGIITKEFPFIVVDDGTLYNNVNRMKQQNLSEGDTYTTSGYYSDNDGGEATYTIMTYEQWYEELPDDVKAISYCSGWWGYFFIKTLVDEYGNHTLNNGLVAKLTNTNNITKVDQWGCIGDGVFNNNTPLIHLFGQTKTGTILFGENKTYRIDTERYNRAYYNDNIFSSFKDNNLRSNKTICVTNEYACSACGQYMGTYNNYRKPTIANAKNIILDGNNSEIFIGDNAFSCGGNDFGCFEFINSIDGLEIKNFIFNGNGLNQLTYKNKDYVTNNMRTTNHTLFYCGGNCSTLFNDENSDFPKQFLRLGLDSSIYSKYTPKLNNVNIHNNNFKNNGTAIQTNDQGGDFILIINPDESQNVYIEDNHFENCGRWVFSVDLGGNGERFYNYKFNRNKCIITDDNYFISTDGERRYRGLGWIDFEARKCWTGLEVCDNYVDGLPCFAMNGAGQVSENVVISGNTIIRKDLYYYSAYQYVFYFYGVQMKNLIFENNTERCNCSSSFGYTLNNVTIKNNDLRNYIDLSGVYGDMIIDGNRKENGKLDLIINVVGLALPDYLDDNETLHCNFNFINNYGGVRGRFYDLDNLNKYNFINYRIENNVTNVMDIRAFGANELYFDQLQVVKDGLDDYHSLFHSWGVRGAKISTPFISNTDNVSWVKRGGYFCNVGDILVTNENGKKLVCKKAGYLPIEGAWGFAAADREFVAKDIAYSKESYFHANNHLYVSLNSGTLGEIPPSHTEGTQINGEVELKYLYDLAETEIIETN